MTVVDEGLAAKESRNGMEDGRKRGRERKRRERERVRLLALEGASSLFEDRRAVGELLALR